MKGVVEERDSWVGKADHPFKAHPTIKAGGVPSLILFEGDKERVRAENEDDFGNEDLMDMISRVNE